MTLDSIERLGSKGHGQKRYLHCIFILLFKKLIRPTFKGEFHFENDKLLSGGQMEEMTNSTNYREVIFFKYFALSSFPQILFILYLY